MKTFFAVFDEAGLHPAFYSEDIHGPRMIPVYGDASEPTEDNPDPAIPMISQQENPNCMIPEGAIEITEAQWQDYLANQLFRRWDGSDFVEYTPIELPVEIPSMVSDRQFFQALATRGEITEDEALDAVGPGIIPARMLALIEQLPADSQFGAKMLIRGATTFERDNPLAGLIGTLFGWDAEALDDFWSFAATL